MKLQKKFTLETAVHLQKIISSQIAKVKIYVMYAGKNRNQTHFTKEMIEQKLVPTMYGMPIIGEYLVPRNDFGGHGGKVTIHDGEIEFEQTTVAYGFIPESSNITWEVVTERDGITQREYLVADAYVWYKRFPEVEKILDEPRNQSMEIEILDGFWDAELNAYDIKDAEFTGACILGLDTEPCFESARIGRFALEQMKFEISEMAKELKETLKQSEVKEVNNHSHDATYTEATEAPVVETTEVEEVEAVEVEETETVEVEAEPEVVEESATEEEAEQATEEPEVEEVAEEATVEPEVEPEVEVQEETQEVSAESAESAGVDYAQENADLKATIEAYEAELAELRAFKAEKDMQEKQEVVDSFKAEFTEEELQPVVEKMGEFSKEDLEIQLFALLGKKQKQYTVNKPKADVDKVVTMAEFQMEEETIPSWAKAIERYTQK